MRFRRWLARQTHRDDAVGQLARDLAAGGGIPSGDAWMASWLGQETSEDALIERWKQAWREWEVSDERAN